MSEPHSPEQNAFDPSREETLSALFAQLVMQQANMATMLLGKVPHPDTGQVVKNIDAARLFIDELEMLEVKTKGNLNKDEAALLKQSLMSLHLAFVEAVEPLASSPEPRPKGAEGQVKPSQAGATSPPPSAPAEEEHQKKFSKKY